MTAAQQNWDKDFHILWWELNVETTILSHLQCNGILKTRLVCSTYAYFIITKITFFWLSDRNMWGDLRRSDNRYTQWGIRLVNLLLLSNLCLLDLKKCCKDVQEHGLHKSTSNVCDCSWGKIRCRAQWHQHRSWTEKEAKARKAKGSSVWWMPCFCSREK